VHPQVGAGGIRALSHARAPMTMGEVLGVLLSKARVEAEDAQRVLLAALNGLAGLLLLQGLPAEAARAYREALRLVAANAEHVRADRLQQLHAAHNLAELLEGGGGGGGELPRTLRDGELRAQAAALREEYLAEAVARLAAAEAELAEAEAAVDRARDGLRRAAGPAAADGPPVDPRRVGAQAAVALLLGLDEGEPQRERLQTETLALRDGGHLAP
jgi:E3 ubiquitin-protein ligase SHPRH